EVGALFYRQAMISPRALTANPKDTRQADLYRQSLEIRKRALGQQHPDVAESLEGLATREPDKAVALLSEALVIRKKTLGEMHPSYARTLERLGLALPRPKEEEEAADLYRQALDIRRKLFAADDLPSMNLLTYLSEHHRRKKEFAEAERYIQQQLSITRRRL